HRGHTPFGTVRYTFESRKTPRALPDPIAPVSMFTLPVTGPLYRLTRQTGTPDAMRGMGGPKVGPLTEPSPVGPSPAHEGFTWASQPVRQIVNVVFPGKGKFW